MAGAANRNERALAEAGVDMARVAPKGRNSMSATRLFRPYRAWFHFSDHSQGDARGFIISAFQAHDTAEAAHCQECQSDRHLSVIPFCVLRGAPRLDF